MRDTQAVLTPCISEDAGWSERKRYLYDRKIRGEAIDDMNDEEKTDDNREPLNRVDQLRCSLLCGFYAIVGAFPLAALVALVFRFPIPFAGYRSGFEAVGPALIAVLIYELIGGFIVLGLLGAVGGGVVYFRQRTSPKLLRRKLLYVAGAIDFVVVMIMAGLDFIVGPW